MGTIVRETDSPEDLRRNLTTQAMVLDARGEAAAGLQMARRATRVKESDTAYEDGFGSRVEATWMTAVLLTRLGREAQAAHAIQKTTELLMRRAKMLEGEDREGFLSRHPLHVAIQRGAVDTKPGTTW